MDHDALRDLSKQLSRRASRAIVGGFRPSDDPFASWFGKVNLAAAGEDWPTSAGRPMMPLAQFNMAEVPFRPESVSDIAFLTVFIGQEELPAGTPNGEGWLLRAYSSVDGLLPIAAPTDRGSIRAFPIRWELIQADYPCWDDAWQTPMPPRIKENYHDYFETQDGSKVGGWPRLIQSEILWAPWNQHPASPEYVFQIDSEEKAHWAWGDGGVGYFGRGTGETRDVRTLEWQCY